MQISSTKKTRNVLATVLVLSLGLHVAGLAVFGVIRIAQQVFREEVAFEAPPILEPLQREPEYTVNLQRDQQSSPPPPPSAIVVADPQDVDVPTLDVNVNVASTSAYGRGGGGFGGSVAGPARIREMEIDLTALGYTGRVEGTLEGTLFDFKKDRNGKKLVEQTIDASDVDREMGKRMRDLVQDFAEGSWNVGELSRKYLSSEKKLYAAYFMIPLQSASLAPEAFDAADEIEPVNIAAFYEGEFIPRETGNFRFVGVGDDFLAVRVNGRVVLDAGFHSATRSHVGEEEPDRRFGMNREARRGEWMKWTAGKPMRMEVILGESPGGRFGFYLLVEKRDEEGLKVFTTKELNAKERRLLRDFHPSIDDYL